MPIRMFVLKVRNNERKLLTHRTVEKIVSVITQGSIGLKLWI